MIDEFKVLARIKQQREERALQSLRAKQMQVREAQNKEAKQHAAIKDSAEVLPGKIEAIYNKIMDQVVGLIDIDFTNEKVRSEREAHQVLEDDLERLIQVRMRLEDELEKARLAHQRAQRQTEKFSTLSEHLIVEAAREEEARTEIEIEELFSKGQALPA